MNNTGLARSIELCSGILLLLAFLPFLVWGYLLNRYGVDIPYQDQWDMPYRAIYEAVSGNFSFATYFLQENEARKVIPTALSVGLATLVGKWDTKIELFVGFSLCVILVSGLFVIARQTCALSKLHAAFLTFLFSWLLWSPLTWYFHSWSITFERLIPEVSLIAGAWLALKRGSVFKEILVFSLLAAIAQYSFPGGIILWLLLGLLLIRRKLCRDQVGWIFLVLYASISILSVTVYFYNYQPMPFHTPLSAILDQPLLSITGFFLAFLGRSFSNIPLLMIILGGVSLLIFGVGLYLAQNRQLLGLGTWIWAIVGLYSISQGLLVTAGRLPMSFSHILRQDYVLYGIYLLVAGIALILSSGSHFRRVKQVIISITLMILMVPFINGIESPSALEQMRKWHQDLTAARSCLLITNHFGESLDCPGGLYPPEPNLPIFKTGLGIKYGFLNFGKFQEVSGPVSGYVDSYTVTISGIKMSGRVIGRGRNRVDIVVVLKDKDDFGGKLIAIFPITNSRLNVANITSSELIYAGWNGEISTQRFFQGENLTKVFCTLRVVGFNSNSGYAFPLIWNRPNCTDTSPLLKSPDSPQVF